MGLEEKWLKLKRGVYRVWMKCGEEGNKKIRVYVTD